jgi:hypothetical protein
MPPSRMTRDRSIARQDGGAYVGFAASANKLLYDIVQILRAVRSLLSHAGRPDSSRCTEQLS